MNSVVQPCDFNTAACDEAQVVLPVIHESTDDKARLEHVLYSEHMREVLDNGVTAQRCQRRGAFVV